MRSLWESQQMGKDPGETAGLSPENEVFNRVWMKVEDRLANRKKTFLEFNRLETLGPPWRLGYFGRLPLCGLHRGQLRTGPGG